MILILQQSTSLSYIIIINIRYHYRKRNPQKRHFHLRQFAANVQETCCNAANEPSPSFGSRSSQHTPPPFHCRYSSLSHWNASRPATDRIPLLFRDRHGPVGKGKSRALFEKPGIVLPPALVAFQRFVDARIRPAGEPLQVLDRELVPPGLLDSAEQVRLFLRHLRFLPACRAVQQREDIICCGEIRLVRIHAKRPVLARLLLALPDRTALRGS